MQYLANALKLNKVITIYLPPFFIIHMRFIQTLTALFLGSNQIGNDEKEQVTSIFKKNISLNVYL
jgi:hypothetical protein